MTLFEHNSEIFEHRTLEILVESLSIMWKTLQVATDLRQVDIAKYYPHLKRWRSRRIHVTGENREGKKNTKTDWLLIRGL